MMNTLYDIGKTALKLFLKKGTFRSYSQYGEDAFISSFFRNKKDGFYVDVGAYHPHLYSNTYAFYRKGWCGIAIDPNPRMKTLFSIFRPRDIFKCVGVGIGERTYKKNDDGAFNSFVEGRGTKLHSLSDILEEHGVTRIDLLSIDVEGLDLEVLKTHNWDIKPSIIAVESEPGGDVQSFLEEKGYHLESTLGLTLIFREKSFTP